MAERKPLFMSADGWSEEMAQADSLTLGGLTMGGAIAMGTNKITGLGSATADGDALAYGQSGANLAGLSIDTNPLTMGGQKITGLADGSPGSQDAATVAQMELAISTGASFKEPVHHHDQLVNGGSGGIRAAELIKFTAQPAVGDTITLKNGSLTRTYTFVANQGAEALATDVSIESSADTAMARFMTRVLADVGNTQWTGFYHPSSSIYANHIDLFKAGTPSSALANDRVYGTWATQANLQVVEFSNGTVAIPYTSGVLATASTTDPGSGRFGFSRAYADLVDGEIHFSTDDNALYAWELSANQWNQISGAGSVPDATSGAGGGTKGVVTADENFGLVIGSGAILKIDLATDPGLQFTSGNLDLKVEASKGLTKTSAGLAGVPDGTKGIEVGAGGFAVKLAATDPALQFATGGLEAKVDGTTGAMQKGAAGLQVKLEPAKGLSIGASGLAGVADGTTGAMSVGASGFAVKLQANSGLEIGASGLAVDVQPTTGATDRDANGVKVLVNANKGMLIGTSGVELKLAATTPGLQFDGSGDLQAKVDATRGQGLDAAGLYTKVDLAAGFKFDGSGNLQLALDDTPDTLDVDADGLKVVGLPSLFKVNGTAVGAAVTAANLDTLTNGTNADALHVHSAAATTGRVEEDINVDEAISVADPVYYTATGNRVGKARADTDAKAYVTGVARTAQAVVGSPATVVAIGKASAVLSGATPGTRYFLQATGGIGTSVPGAGRRVIEVGVARSATDLWVRILDHGKKAA